MPGPVGNWQELCPACKRKSLSIAHQKIERGSEWLKRPSGRGPESRKNRSAFELQTAWRLERRIRSSSREAGQNALLLLRAAMRNSTKGPRESSDRVRALGGVPVQWRHALPERSEAVSPGQSPGSAARPPLMRSAQGFRPASWDEALEPYREPYARDSSQIWQGRLRNLRRRIAPRRRNRTCSASLPGWRWALVTSTTTGDCAWFLPERHTSWRSASIEAQSRGARFPKRRYCL